MCKHCITTNIKTMKRLATLAALLCMMTLSAGAQDVFNEIYKTAEKAAQDKTNTLEDRKFNTFKMDALSYMKTKTLDGMMARSRELADTIPDKTIERLNYQAYAMYSFLNLYLKRLSKADTNKGMFNVKKKFREASLNNPYYNDEDKELVNAYVDNKNFNTPFSLDTDWLKALEEVKK